MLEDQRVSRRSKPKGSAFDPHVHDAVESHEPDVDRHHGQASLSQGLPHGRSTCSGRRWSWSRDRRNERL